MWTRPGFNFVLFWTGEHGSALFCWWRPKWEHGAPGTRRKDGLCVLECTMFRRVGTTPLASDLIRAATVALETEDARNDLALDRAGPISMLITGVSSEKTKRGRAPRHRAGRCFAAAGWAYMDKRTKRADTWLCCPWRNPWSRSCLTITL